MMMMMVVATTVAGCGDPGAELCKSVSGSCKGVAAGASEATLAQAFATAKAGSTIVLGAGTYKLKNTLSCPTAASNLTIKGAGMDDTILDFSDQAVGSQGITCNVNGLVMEGLTVQDTLGDGIKAEGNDGVTFRKVKVTWTRPDEQTHGAYGLYPVLAKKVLVEDCVVEGAADAGIYVGQSETIIVRRSSVRKNVAGIEIENSDGADVYDNDATDNTAGILVFSLPIQGTPRPHNQNTRVFQNRSLSNNRLNFGKPGSIISKVPAGTGMLVMASDSVEVFDNDIRSNNTGGAAVVSFLVAQIDWDKNSPYNPYPTNIWIHDNRFQGNGAMPDDTNLGIGVVLAQNFKQGVPPLLWDGIEDTARTETRPGNRQDICFSNNGSVTFANLNADEINGTMLPNVQTDITPFTCMLTALPAITIPGVAP